jgi:hypothetical protein
MVAGFEDSWSPIAEVALVSILGMVADEISKVSGRFFEVDNLYD